MPSGQFGSIAIGDITIGPRQRTKVRKELDRLKQSIKDRGLIHPIVLDRDHVLIAGQGRLTACKELGFDRITFQYADDLTYAQRRMLELEENVVREDLSWDEQHFAYMELIELIRLEKPDATTSDLALRLNISQSSVSKHMVFDQYKDHPTVAAAAVRNGFDSGYRQAVITRDREFADSVHIYADRIDTHHSPILTGDFHTWAPQYSGPKFNLIHCDFPYGISEHTNARQNSQLPVEYDDSPDMFWDLLITLDDFLDNFCADSAHMIFWFSPRYYRDTLVALQNLNGFQWEEYPLIWHRGNAGIAPDVNRRPRRTYETAFFGWRGDRKIVRVKDNLITAPIERQRHPHEKSEAALRHFMEMCIDGNTRLFDPTCGSGSALRAGKSLGAANVFGIEQNEEYATLARRALEQSSPSEALYAAS